MRTSDSGFKRLVMRTILCCMTIMYCVNISAKPHAENTDSIKLKSFKSITLIGNEQTVVQLSHGANYALSLTGCKRKDIKIEDSDSTLIVSIPKNKEPKPIIIKVYAPEWHFIICPQANTLQTVGCINTSELNISAALVKQIYLLLKADRLDFTCLDAEQATLSGTCKEANIHFAGTSTEKALLHAQNLQIDNLTLSCGAETQTFVQVINSVILQNTVLSEITIYGSPAEIKNDTHSSSIHILPEK